MSAAIRSQEWRPSSAVYDDIGRISAFSARTAVSTAASSATTSPSERERKQGKMLAISFCAMVVVGLGNKIFQKLETVPMKHYANFLNLLTTFFYIPISFAYIIPMMRKGKITKEELAVPKKTFFVIGLLDAVAAVMQIFAATNLPGTLLILLTQAAIPVNMVISKVMLKETYSWEQYIGATVVAGGITCVLLPKLLSGQDGSDDESAADTLQWSVVLMLSCVPMCLSSVYKEIALGDTQMDAIFMNGWIAVFQFLLSIPMAIPAAYTGDPKVAIGDLPENLWNGMRCFVGINSIADDTDGNGGDHCSLAPVYVSVYLLFNVGYNILILVIIKFGSSNVLWLAMTIMVPLGNIAFTLDFMPDTQNLAATDIIGLVIICAGLVFYRYWMALETLIFGSVREGGQLAVEEQALIHSHQHQQQLPTTSSHSVGSSSSVNTPILEETEDKVTGSGSFVGRNIGVKEDEDSE